MTPVVILSWHPGARRLEYVEVRSGLGGPPVTAEASVESGDLITAELAGQDLPCTAVLDIDGSDVLVDGSGSLPAVRCSVTSSGSREDRQFRLRRKGPSKDAWLFPAASLGISDPDSAAAAVSRFDYLLVNADAASPGCWLRKDGNEGGIDAFAAQRQEEREKEKGRRAAEIAEAAAAEAADTTFINPYTFVPFPERIARAEPPGHALLGKGRLSGSFTVTWEFTTPFQAQEEVSGTALLRLPGSSVKGAIRSVHEALAGGCLRVFDDQFTPSYRDVANVRADSWTMATVTEATMDGQPLAVQLCDEVVWVPLANLRAVPGSSLSTGSRVVIADSDVPPHRNSLGRKELADSAVVWRAGEDGKWVVLVTAAGTRVKEKVSKKTGETKPGGYFLACGRLSKETAKVGEDAWHGFQFAAAGADDMRKKKRTSRQAEAAGDDAGMAEELPAEPEKQPTELVIFHGTEVGRRRVVTGRLWPRDVIWVKVSQDGGEVEEISLAALWRHPGWGVGRDGSRRGSADSWTAGERVPGHLRACDDPGLLCPSCRVFGSADTSVRGRDDRSDQRAYAGHVRFGDACSREPVTLTEILRAPMGAPRPGAGQFYLSYTDTSPARDRDDKPTREWGAAPDIVDRRQLRGRKFYWHADPDRQDPPRHKARRHQLTRPDGKPSELVDHRWIAPAGTQLSQQVTFDNLDQADLGGLLAAFEPRRVLCADPDRELRLHLGGGKPLGLGSCRATVSGLRVWTARSRYGTEPPAQPDRGSWDAAFLSQVPVEVTATWPALEAALADDTVDPARVWYPPGARWSERRAQAEKFDRPFAFFTASSGMALHDKRSTLRKLIPLPAPDAEDQALPIMTKDDR
jgi:CRISPR-associated protein (TIGR03986 family)